MLAWDTRCTIPADLGLLNLVVAGFEAPNLRFGELLRMPSCVVSVILHRSDGF